MTALPGERGSLDTLFSELPATQRLLNPHALIEFMFQVRQEDIVIYCMLDDIFHILYFYLEDLH